MMPMVMVCTAHDRFSGYPTCDADADTVSGWRLGAVKVHHSHLKVPLPPVSQGQGEVHEGIKLDGVVLAILHGTDECRLVQALRSKRMSQNHVPPLMRQCSNRDQI